MPLLPSAKLIQRLQDSILQLISLSSSFPVVNIVIYGASEASLVATELAAARIPVILTSTRPAPDSFQKLDVQSGPPLSRSPAAVLIEAGVKLAIAIGNTGLYFFSPEVTSVHRSTFSASRNIRWHLE